jgi:hypothetical protein
MKTFFSVKDPEPAIMIAEIPRITNERTIIARVITREIVINDQKFFDPALKNSAVEKFTFPFRRLSNNPPVRKAFMTKEIRITNRKPVEKEAIMFFNAWPSSIKVRRSKPSAKLPVIMLLPNALRNDPLNGITRSETERTENSQNSRIPFHDLTARTKPETKELRIFIKYYITIIYSLKIIAEKK